MKYFDKVKAFVDKELEEYSYFEGRELEYQEGDDLEYFQLTLNLNTNVKRYVNLRASKKDGDDDDPKIEVELGEGSWYTSNWWDTSIKYFWQAILVW